MSAPINISAATATDIPTLPASIAQTVDDAGTTYTVWYKYTAVAGDVQIGLFGFGDLSTYTPRTEVWTGPPPTMLPHPSGVSYLILIYATNKPVQFPVTPGTTYYFSFTTNAGNPAPAVLTIEIESFAQTATAVGMIAVNDDTAKFPLVLLDPATGDPARFINPFPNGEAGDVLASNGIMCIEDFANNEVVIFDEDFNEVARVTDGESPRIRACQAGDIFYVGQQTNPVQYYTIDETGTTTAPVVLTGTLYINSLAANNAETILYHSGDPGDAIHRWDIPGGAALSDLVAGISGYYVVDILVLSDDTIIALYADYADVVVKHYNAAGATLHTYNFGADTFPSGTFPRLAYAIDDPTTFWIWTHPTGADAGLSRFREVTVATGAFATDVTTTEYEHGTYNRTATATPSARFGISFSCPFWIVRSGGPPPGTTGTVIVVKQTAPSSDTTSFDFTAAGGLTPTSFSLATGNQQTFNSVPVGSGYSVIETVNPTYTTSVSVSNGDPHTSFSVADGETVVVTFTNSSYFYPNFSGTLEDVPRRWLRRSPVQSSENRRIVHQYLNIDFQPAVGLSSGQGSDPQAMMRWSDDGGLTWGNELWRSMGKIGSTFWRAVWWRLGMARNRVYEVSGSDPVKTVIHDAYIQAEGSEDSPTS